MRGSLSSSSSSRDIGEQRASSCGFLLRAHPSVVVSVGAEALVSGVAWRLSSGFKSLECRQVLRKTGPVRASVVWTQWADSFRLFAKSENVKWLVSCY